MKKASLFSMFILFSTGAFGCQVYIKNSGNKAVHVRDLDHPETPNKAVYRNYVAANINPDEHANLKIGIGKEMFIVRQVACGKEKDIYLDAKHISSKRLSRDKEINRLFKVNKIR